MGRKRRPNWTEEDKMVLLNEYKKRKAILHPSSTCTTSTQTAVRVWNPSSVSCGSVEMNDSMNVSLSSLVPPQVCTIKQSSLHNWARARTHWALRHCMALIRHRLLSQAAWPPFSIQMQCTAPDNKCLPHLLLNRLIWGLTWSMWECTVSTE